MELSMSSLTLEDVTIDVDYKFYKGCRGARDSFMGKRGAGAQLEPDEPESVEVMSITMFGKEIEVSEKSIMEIEEAIMRELEEDDRDE